MSNAKDEKVEIRHRAKLKVNHDQAFLKNLNFFKKEKTSPEKDLKT